MHRHTATGKTSWEAQLPMEVSECWWEEWRGSSMCTRALFVLCPPSLAPYRFLGLLKLGGGQSVSIVAGTAHHRASPLIGSTSSPMVSQQTFVVIHPVSMSWRAWSQCRMPIDHTVVIFLGFNFFFFLFVDLYVVPPRAINYMNPLARVGPD
jgi:hypothetical protein